ncbi:hypothetical protein CVAR21S_01677 [Corynebacterium variabile]
MQTSSSTQVAPALTRSVRRVGDEVQGAAGHGVRVGENPGAVTDGGDRLTRRRHAADQLDGMLIEAQLVGVADTAGQDEPAERRGVRVGGDHVRGESGSALTGDDAVLRRDNEDAAASLFHGVLRLADFRVLEAGGGQDRDGPLTEIAHAT